MKKIKLKPLLISLAISLGVGALSGVLSMGGFESYGQVAQPPLSPPDWIFPVVWTILFTLMGISAYLVYVSDSPYRNSALLVYGVQLVVNFMWPLLFFNAQQFLLAFIWLVLLWVLIILMIIKFYRVRPLAAWLQIPYLLWVSFAGYLNLAVYLLNG